MGRPRKYQPPIVRAKPAVRAAEEHPQDLPDWLDRQPDALTAGDIRRMLHIGKNHPLPPVRYYRGEPDTPQSRRYDPKSLARWLRERAVDPDDQAAYCRTLDEWEGGLGVMELSWLLHTTYAHARRMLGLPADYQGTISEPGGRLLSRAAGPEEG